MAKKLKYSIKQYRNAVLKALERYEQLKQREKQEHELNSVAMFVFSEQNNIDVLGELFQALKNLEYSGTIDGTALPVAQINLFE